MTEDQKLFEDISAFCQKMFADIGEVQPMWILQDVDGRQIVVATPFTGDDSKEQIAHYMKDLIREKKIVRYGFMSEAWVLELNQQHPDYARAEQARPSKHQDRREVITFHVESADGQSGGQFYILRPEHGKAKLSTLKPMDADHIGGRFAGMLYSHQA